MATDCVTVFVVPLKGALLGVVTDLFGKQVYEVRAPFGGEVLYVISTPPISAGEPLAFVGTVKR